MMSLLAIRFASRKCNNSSIQILQPLERIPTYATAEEAIKVVKSGDVVFAQGAAATSIHLLNALTKHDKENNLRDISVVHMHTEGPARLGRSFNTGPNISRYFGTLISNSFRWTPSMIFPAASSDEMVLNAEGIRMRISFRHLSVITNGYK